MKTIDEVIAERDKLAIQYEGGLPDYLQDYFDNKIKNLRVSEEIVTRKRTIYASSKEDKIEYLTKRDEEFWSNHKYRIVKKKKTTSNPVFEEPPKGEERVEEDIVLSELERRLLINAASEDLYLFAVRYFSHYLKKPSSELHRYIYKFLSREVNKTNRRRGFRKAIAAPRGNAKCLKENTLIQLKSGKLVQIKNIKIGDSVVSINKDLKLTYDRVIAKEKSGVKKVKDLTLRSGRTVTLTDEHRLFNIDGEIKLKDIEIGEKIATPRELKCSYSRTMQLDEAIFLANMLAEGCMAKNAPLRKTKGYAFKCSYTNFDNAVVEDFKKACFNLGFGISGSSKDGQYNIQKAIPYLRHLKLGGHTALTKSIPDKVFNQNNEFLKLFISRFIATDGWVTEVNPSFGITLANERMIDQLFTILLRIGFRPTKQSKPNNKAGAWAVVVHGVDQLKVLAKIGILHKQAKLINTIERFSKNKPNPNIDTIDNRWKKYLKNTTPYFLRKNNNIRVDSNKYHNSRSKVLQVAKIDKNKFLTKLAKSDIYWDEVVSISESYEAVTYDIETEIYHNFIANNIVSHNSSLVSTIFPLWCICYEKKKFIIMVSDTSGQAVDFLSDVKRELEFNKALHADFPHVMGHGPTWKTDEIITSNDIKLLALGTKSRIRGRKFGIHRPDLVICDDLENSEMIRSESERDYVRNQWFNKDLLHVEGEEGTQTDVFIVGTVLGKDSLLNALLDPEEYPQFASKRFSAVIKFAENEELWQKWEKLYKNRFDTDREINARKFYEDNEEVMLYGSVVLWPEGDPYYDLMVTKISDYSGFLCEKQNSPIDYSKVLISEDSIISESFSSNPLMLSILNDKRNPIYGAIDVSLGKKSSSGDYSCITTVVRDLKTGLLLVTYFDIKRRSVDLQIEAILKSHNRFKYTLFAIETNAFQYVVAENLRKVSRREGVYIPLQEINNYQDKKMRVEGIVPFVLDGTIVFDSQLMRHNQMYALAMDQVTTFTGENDKHDDAPDSLEMAVRISTQKKYKRRFKQNR